MTTKMKKTNATKNGKKPMNSYYSLSRQVNKKHKLRKTKIIIGIIISLLVVVGAAIAYLNAQMEKVFNGSGDVFTITTSENNSNNSNYHMTVGDNENFTYIIQATVAAEDENYYFRSDVSPITKKYIRLEYFSDNGEGDSSSRENEINRLAAELEKSYNKDEILLLYLNSNIYGEDAYGQKIRGIEYAAYFNFNKSAKDLTLTEAAIIASVGDNPAITVYDLSIRKDEILDKMVALGYITTEEAEKAKTAYLPAFK